MLTSSYMKCKNCKWLHNDNTCHRYPPKVRSIDGYKTSYWPGVSNLDWCGEFSDVKELITEQTQDELANYMWEG